MSAPGAHPSGDIWPGILDHYRCQSTRDGRRCQLFRRHDDLEHAHAERLPTKRFEAVTHRWEDAGAAWSGETPAGMPWCCMFQS